MTTKKLTIKKGKTKTEVEQNATSHIVPKVVLNALEKEIVLISAPNGLADQFLPSPAEPPDEGLTVVRFMLSEIANTHKRTARLQKEIDRLSTQTREALGRLKAA